MRLILALVFLVNEAAFATQGISVVTVSMDQRLDSPRWMFDAKAPVKGGALIEQMVEAKKGFNTKDRAKCLTALGKASSQGKSLGPWISLNQLNCAQLPDKKGAFSIQSLNTAIAKVDAQPRWLLSGPSSGPLKTAYVSSLLLLAEQQSKTDRRNAWGTLDKLQQTRSWLSNEEKAKVYKWAGEIAFIEQNLSAAVEFLQRSLSEKEQADLRERVDSIRSSLIAAAPKKKSDGASVAPGSTSAGTTSVDLASTSAVEVPVPSPDLGMTDEERDIWTRMDRAYNAQDYISAIEDAIELIQKFPGSRRTAEASDRVLDIYLTISSRSEEKFRHVRETVVKEMGKADAGRLSRWANNAFARGNYLDALNLSEKAYDKFGGHPDSTKILLLAGRSAIASGEYGAAEKHFDTLLKKHGGTVEAAEATFRLGLLAYRRKRFADAAAYFERVLALTAGKDFEYKALYLQWRAQQKLDSSKAAAFTPPLIKKYPLSYYGLRALAETSGGFIDVGRKPTVVKADMRFMQTERLAWERLTVLLKAGWFKEAEKELEFLPEPQSPEERLIRAKLWAASFRYDLAISSMNKAFDENPDLIQASVLKTVFPLEYEAAVARESKTFDVPAVWIRSLMRQESSFRYDAKSSSNALGVMQLIPPTGTEVATDLKIKNFTIPDSLLDTDINIKLGTAYMARMIRGFKGNIPLGLAAYNAGPTRLRKWLSARKDMDGIENVASSSPEAEIWVDELPWEETSFYVKAILRNWLIYRLLDGSKVKLSEPIWVDEKATAG